MRLFKIVLAPILAGVLVIGVALPGLAASKVAVSPAGDYQRQGEPLAEERPPHKMLRGKVVEIDEGKTYFVIQRGDEEPVKISVDNGTHYLKVPALKMQALRQRIAQGNGNHLNADEVRPLVPKELKRLNQGRLMRKGKHFNQLESRPTDATELTPGEGKEIGKLERQNWLQLRRSGKEAPRKIGGLLRQRMALRNANQANAGEVRPVMSRRPKLANPGQLMRKRQDFDPQALRPTDAPEPILGEGKSKDKAGRPWNLQRLRRFAEDATFDDIAMDGRVAVRLVPGQEEPLARLVMIFEPSAFQRVRGTITAISSEEKTITITPANEGEAVTLNYNEDTVFVLKGTIAVEVGQSVGVIYYTEDLIAKRVRVHLESE